MHRKYFIVFYLYLTGILFGQANGQTAADLLNAIQDNTEAITNIVGTLLPGLQAQNANILNLVNAIQNFAVNNGNAIALLSATVNTLNNAVNALITNVNNLNTAVTNLGTTFTNIGNTLTAIQNLQTAITNGLNTASLTVSNIETAVTSNGVLINGIDSKADGLKSTLDDTRDQVNILQTTVTDTNMRIVRVENTANRISGMIDAIDLLLRATDAKVEWLKKSGENIEKSANILIDMCNSISTKIEMVKDTIESKIPNITPLLNEIESDVEVVHESRNILGFFNEKVDFLTARVDVLFLSKEITYISHGRMGDHALQNIV